MKNAGRICFLIICFAMCLLPSAGMLVQPSDTSSENRTLAKMPDIKEDGKWNIDFLPQLGTYFQDHFAFRSELVSADAQIQSRIFRVSNVDTITVGTDGWLYYTATVDDYMGRSLLSERGIRNIVHNLSLVQDYVQHHGAKFLFTVPPNKNSLYGEHMPYYLQKKAGTVHNMDMLEKKIKKSGISYADLFQLFETQKEQLYLKRDSHWNEKGAVLVYDMLLNELNIEHDRYETVKAIRSKDAYGDLNRMLYPLTGEPEWDYDYKKDPVFLYHTDTESVEDAWIETENKSGSGTLLMFRDSFGNTLLPLMADTFANGYFSRAVPQNISRYMEQCKPDVVILEKVERNISELAKMPPIVEGAAVTLDQKPELIDSDTSNTSIEIKGEDALYWIISGRLDNSLWSEDAKIYIRVSENETQTTYKTFWVTNEESDYGYQLSLPKESITGLGVGLEVIVKSKGRCQIVKTAYVDLD